MQVLRRFSSYYDIADIGADPAANDDLFAVGWTYWETGNGPTATSREYRAIIVRVSPGATEPTLEASLAGRLGRQGDMPMPPDRS